MSKISRYTCGNGDGMFDNEEGHWVTHEDHLRLLNTVREVEMTGEEQLTMYMKCSKEELSKMLIEANRVLKMLSTPVTLPDGSNSWNCNFWISDGSTSMNCMSCGQPQHMH
jgi:hypothetical protein